MVISQTTKSFHLRAIELKNKLGNSKVAPRLVWKQCENEYFLLTGKNRYKKFETFAVENSKFKNKILMIKQSI